MMTHTFVLGCGYVGTRVARQCLKQGQSVTGLVRTGGSSARLTQAGVRPVRRDLATDDLSDLTFAGTDVFHLAPPPRYGSEDLHTRRLIAAFDRTGHPRRVLYVSTTGVYGDCHGDWVDETHPARPEADRSRRRWDAEESLRRWGRSSGGELVILRVAGIYGPGRLPLERLAARTPMVRPEEAPFTNRIHVDDLVTACLAAMEHGLDGAVYNACDDSPSTMTQYFIDVADAAGLPRPPLISLDEAADRLSPGMLSYLAESRRVCNRRLREELGVELRYPSLADGLSAQFDAAGDRTRPPAG